MEFEFRKVTTFNLDIDFAKLFDFVAKDLGIETVDSEGIDRIYTHFGDNVAWFIESMYADDPIDCIVSEIVYDELNDVTLDYIWEEFGKWIDENKRN